MSDHTYVCANCERTLPCIKSNCRGEACRIQCPSCVELGFRKKAENAEKETRYSLDAVAIQGAKVSIEVKGEIKTARQWGSPPGGPWRERNHTSYDER